MSREFEPKRNYHSGRTDAAHKTLSEAMHYPNMRKLLSGEAVQIHERSLRGLRVTEVDARKNAEALIPNKGNGLVKRVEVAYSAAHGAPSLEEIKEKEENGSK